jgi:hypothetical protein
VSMPSNPARNDDPGRDIAEGADQAARLPSLEEQTPGLDTEQEQRTLRDAERFYESRQGEQRDPASDNQAVMSEQDMQEPPQ